MSRSSSIQFINTALSCTSPYALSYPDHKQTRLIRKHLLSLIQDYPTFRPSTDKFTHNDGTTVNLLNATGNLSVSSYSPPIPLTIWLHENYPYMPPLVFVLSSSSLSPIHKNHPFVDSSSGAAATTAYLQSWVFACRNLSQLVRNLINIFNLDHPFIFTCSASSFTRFPSRSSKMEALDRLSGMIHYDTVALKEKNEEEIQELYHIQQELKKRDDITKNIVANLEEEKLRLKDRVMKLMEEADVLMNWLKVNDMKSIVEVRSGDDDDDGFEGVDEESKMVIDCLGADRGIEDLIYRLEKAVKEGVVPFDSYIRQIRNLAREQFYHRDMLLKLRGPSILH